MNTLVTNIASLVIFPSVIVTGFLYVNHRLLDGLLGTQAISGKRTALIAIGIGVYFLGHPFYPTFVPLIRATTSWMFAIGSLYVTLGLISLIFSRYRHFCAVGSWLVAILGIVVAFLVATGFELRSIIRLIEPNSHNFEHSLYLSIPLALMFSFGYDPYLERRTRLVSALLLTFVLYALALVNSFPVMERVRGPLALVFIAFGCIGVLLGIPLYVLGTTLASSSDER